MAEWAVEEDHQAHKQNPGREYELAPLVGAGGHQQRQADQVSEVEHAQQRSDCSNASEEPHIMCREMPMSSADE